MGVSVTVSRWGTSLGVRIPMQYAKSTGIGAGDMIDISLRGDDIVIRKPERDITMKELYSAWDGEPYEIDDADRAWLDDKPKGAELW